MLNLHKEKVIGDRSKKRINVKKILDLDELIKRPYSKVTIELENNLKINKLKKILSLSGETEIKIVIKEKNRKVHYLLQNLRKFDFKHLKTLKSKEYVSKITV